MNYLPRLVLNLNLTISACQVARITGMSHYGLALFQIILNWMALINHLQISSYLSIFINYFECNCVYYSLLTN
jgi:hypothetical protein